MESIAFMFPGQGSQRAGMGLDFSRYRPSLIHDFYRVADDLLQFPLSQACWHGSAASLRDTAVTQPAVFLTSLVVLDSLRGHGIEPTLVVGHSLGEYAALVCAGVLCWTDALRLVRTRAQLMHDVARDVPGTMSAVLGLKADLVSMICSESASAASGVVEVANDNGPDQVVISGETAAVRHASESCRRAGARRVVPLKVSAPFHCSLMRAIEDDFAAALAAASFGTPRIPVISSVTGDTITTAGQAMTALRRQLTAPVLWSRSIARAAELGAATFIEAGPGQVLTRLCGTIVPTARSYPAGTVKELRQTVRLLAAP